MNQSSPVVLNHTSILLPTQHDRSPPPTLKRIKSHGSRRRPTWTRFRCGFTFLVGVCFTATTAFSTTYPLRSTNNNNHIINTHGLPSKQTSSSSSHEGGVTSSAATVKSQVLDDKKTTKTHLSTILDRDLLPKPTGSTNLIPPPVKKKKDTDEKAQTNDTIEEEKEEEKMQTADDQKFKERIQSSMRTVQSWENVEWLQECRTVIPWDDLRNNTGPWSNPDQDRLMANDANALFLQRLCRWFPKFMTWVNAPPCVKCGCKECEMKAVRGPETEEEKEGSAKRVEVYYCPECKENTTTFPRYNMARKLMDTRKGRCGEYSNLFGLFCRSVGFETRLVLDLSDHLWTEVRLGDHWIMADSCEGIIDKPSMYEYGWGKDGLCFMIAIASDHVVDVTPRYTRKFLTDDFQTRRRTHTTSENATAMILQELNRDLRQNLTKAAIEDLNRRQLLEDAELQLYKQSTEWTPQEKYGRGRISGSMAWKKARQEAGKSNIAGKPKDGGEKSSSNQNTKERQVAGFEVDSFSPPVSTMLSLQVRPKPVGRHDGIIVAGTACAVGEANTVSVVVVDEKFLGCILQSQSFVTWSDAKDFVNRLPAERIVLMNGKCDEDPKIKTLELARLGGWKKDGVTKKGIAFIGQVDVHPDWTFCSTLEDCPPEGYEVELKLNASRPALKLRTEQYTFPTAVAGRLPESVMPLKTQLLANDEQKRLAFISFAPLNAEKYSGYTTKPGAPVYLLDSTSYPLSRMEGTTLEVASRDNAWNTFHFLPPPLVSSDDQGIISSKNNASEIPAYEVPLATDFFNTSLGPQLLANNTTRLPTSDALQNARLVGLYFSAHWCGPCRSFTPMLAEMYAHLKDHRPAHGLEIVFISSDRDAASFGNYYGSMPWQAIPFEQLQLVKASLNMTYGVRGIPSLVILDAVSGQVVVPPDESRQAVALACRGGEQQIEELLDSWLQRVPQDTKEMLAMLELSCKEEKADKSNPSDAAENPYLVAEPAKFSSAVDAAGARIKEFFDKLVAEGNDPTSAAAKAIGLVAEEQKTGNKLPSGSLHGMSTRMGPILESSKLDDAIARAIEWNSPSVVADALATALKYLKNAAKEPWSPKFRHFRLSNKVADQVTRVEGGIAILRSLGFEVVGSSQEFKATIPVSVDLEGICQLLSRLIQDLGDDQ